MKLLISQLLEGENQFSFNSASDAWLREVISQVEEKGYHLTSSLAANLALTKLEPDYYLRGRVEFNVQQNCARCAENFVLPIRHSFDVALAHVANVKVRGAELTEESEELDINFFEGPEIDLSPILVEQFYLSIPYQSVCREECRGVCQQCGKNLNLEQCECHANQALSPFSVLQNLKL